MRAGPRPPFNLTHRRQSRVEELWMISEANEIFCHPCVVPLVVPSYLFAATFPFPSQPTLAAVAAAAGLNKPGKIIKIQANDETLAAKRP